MIGLQNGQVIGAVRAERTRNQIGLVVQLFHHKQNFLPDVLGHPAPVVQHPVNRPD